jgi:hypothetical protein
MFNKYIHFCNDELAGTFFLLNFFYKINTNSTVGKNLNCQVIVVVKMMNFQNGVEHQQASRRAAHFKSFQQNKRNYSWR